MLDGDQRDPDLQWMSTPRKRARASRRREVSGRSDNVTPIRHDIGADRPRMRLVGFRRFPKGALVGFAHLRLPSGLELIDCPVFASGGKRWASLPSKPVLTREGQALVVDGVKQYQPMASWPDRATADRWSAIVIMLIEERDPGTFADDGGAP
jgi:hypothetical protein